jgi:hypothetical protein
LLIVTESQRQFRKLNAGEFESMEIQVLKVLARLAKFSGFYLKGFHAVSINVNKLHDNIYGYYYGNIILRFGTVIS